jgi:hypothetical protein
MRALSLLLLSLAAAPCAWSGTLAIYLFDGTANPKPATSVVPGLIAGDLSMHGLTLGSSDHLFFSGNDWPINAYSGTAYFEVTLAPVAPYAIDYSSVTFDYTIGTNPTFTIELLSSVDGFTTPLSTHVNAPGITGQHDSLASLGIQTGPVTLRLFGFVDATSGQSGFYTGNLSFNGSNAILTPEPQSSWLLAASSIALLAFARRLRSER